jgi:hydroxyethylthiazole kinase-like uncharacterized protein yjeF
MPESDQVLTAGQMRSAEDDLIARGVSIDDLMQRAGRGAAEWVWRVAAGRPVTVLCGPGNNGGDGYVIAETLRRRGLAVAVIAPAEPKTDAARTAGAAWQGPVGLDAAESQGGVFVDCLFGSGLTRPLGGADEMLLAQLARRHAYVVAIDLPSGVRADDGALLGQVPDCDLTLALGAWKPAHFLMPALARLGGTRLVDIGIGEAGGTAEAFPRPRFAPPPRHAHKYTRGLVGIVGGAMPGAAWLAATAAMRSGAGYVRLLAEIPAPAEPRALVIDSAPLANALADPRWGALLVGPGLGRDDGARNMLAAVLEARMPTVLDADALHLLDDDLLEGVDTAKLLLTPHEGELKQLSLTFGITARDKLAVARSLACTTGMTVLAKGPDTVLVAGDGRTAFFGRAPSWLASAGTGDVLAGMAASRLAVGGDPYQAAGEAAWLHSRAANLAGPNLIADDLVRAIPAAYAEFL